MFTLVFILFFFGIWMMNRVYLGVQPGNNMIQSDIKKMRAASGKYLSELVAWKNEELDLLSFNVEQRIKKRGFGKSEQGFFNSIYHEKMFFFAIKEYVSTNKKIIIYTRTKESEIIYQIKKGGAQVYVDADSIGTVAANGDFYNEKNRRFFGSIKRPSKSISEINNEEDVHLGSVVIPDDWDSNIPARATDMEKSLDEKDILLFKILSIYEMCLVHLERGKK